MECTATSTGFACVLDETTAQLRFTTQSEAKEELKTIARSHGFELKVRSSRATAVYLCCLGAAGCSFQAKLANAGRDAMDAWSIAITKPKHNHPLASHQPTPTPTDPKAAWTAIQRTQLERELKQLSNLSDAQRWRVPSTNDNKSEEEESEPEPEPEPEPEVQAEAEAEAEEGAGQVESLIAALDATHREGGVLERLLSVPLPATLAALDTLRESNHLEAKLVHLRIQQLLAIVSQVRKT